VSSRTEAVQLARQLRNEGFDVELTRGSGHWEVRRNGRRVTTFANTPGDHRWKRNALQYIRRWKRSNGVKT